MKTMKTIKLFCVAGILLIALLSIVDTAGAVTITGASVSAGSGTDILIVLTVSELVKEGTFTSSDVTITGEATIRDNAGCLTRLMTCDLSIIPNANSDGDVTVSIAANAFEGVSGTGNTAWSRTVTLPDRKKPTLTITDVPTETKKDAFDITITASEPITGFTADDITFKPSGAAEATLTASTSTPNTWTANITPADDIQGTVTISIPAGAEDVQDAAGNTNTAASTTVTIDTKPPELILTVPDGPHNERFEITVTYSELTTVVSGTTGITPGHVTSAPAGFVSIPGLGEWTSNPLLRIPVIPAANTEKTVTITIAAGIWQDAVGNQNLVASTEVEIDTKPPTLTMTAPTNRLQNSAFDITITALETLTDFTADDITVTPTGAATATLTGSGTTWTATLTPVGVRDEEVTISIPASAVEDTAGNANTASASTTVTIDTLPPTLTMTPPTTPQNEAFSITIEASEALKADNTLTASDITITPTGAATATLTGSGTTWTARVTPVGVRDEEVTISIPANAVTDPVGNQNTAASTTVTIDTVVPTISFVPATIAPQRAGFDLGINFSENVTGFTVSDLTLTGPATLGTDWNPTEAGPQRYDVLLTPDSAANGVVTVTVAAEAAQDAAGNKNAAAQWSVTFDLVPPTLTLTPPTTPQNSVFDITIEASETITGFTTSDITINPTSAATATLTPSTSLSNTWTATLTPVGVRDEVVTISIPANAVTDTVGNPHQRRLP